MSPSDLVRLWVRKEAVLKATGHGLGTSMTSVSLSGEGRATVDHTPFRVVDLEKADLVEALRAEKCRVDELAASVEPEDETLVLTAVLFLMRISGRKVP